MLKKYFIVVLLLFTMIQANDDKWFMELGWQISAPTTTGSYDSFDSSGLNRVHYDWDGTDDMLYIEIGHSFSIKDSEAILSISGGTTFIILDAEDHHNAIFGKFSLLYPSRLFDTRVKIGPKIKILLPYDSYYYDSEDGVYSRKVEYDTDSAFAFGVESIWGEDDWKITTGIEYLTSARYKGSNRDSAGYANTEIDLDGFYFNIGVRYSF